MKILPAKTGPFEERPYYKLQDIEDICFDELRALNLYPDDPEPIRIDRFIEKRFHVTPEYEDLPEGVLGFTDFSTEGVQRIVIARSLSEEGSRVAERRINTTLAHEGGHGLLHAHLFALGTKPRNLFGGETDQPAILCRDVTGAIEIKTRQSYSGRWWEYQANLAIGALLLPRFLVEKALVPYLVAVGSLAAKTIDRTKRDDAIRHVANIFDVNPIVSRIRLQEMYPEGPQLRL